VLIYLENTVLKRLMPNRAKQSDGMRMQQMSNSTLKSTEAHELKNAASAVNCDRLLK
jgi:hypothetical protein